MALLKKRSDKSLINDIEASVVSNLVRKSMEKISETSNSIGDIGTEIRNISKKAGELVNGAGRQADCLNNIRQQLDNVCSFADSTLNKTTELSDNAQATYNKVIKNRQEIENTINEFDLVKSNINNTSGVAQGLQQKVKEANSLIVSIQAIAKQTKILSVNASIEAARAGIHGKGFGVVAEEIMKLSEQTADVNKKVDNIIEEIGKLTQSMKVAMDTSISNIINQSEKLKKAVSEFNGIEKSTKIYSDNNKELANSSNELHDKIYQITEMVDGISDITNENIQATDDVKKSIQLEINQFNKLSDTILNVEDNMIEVLKTTEKSCGTNIDTVIVGVSPYQPYSIIKENGKIEGIDCDIIRKAFIDSGIKVKFMNCTWEGSLKLLENKLIDIVPTITYSKERERHMSFSRSYRKQTKYAFFSLKTNNISIKNYNDLYKYTIGVQSFQYNSKFDKDSMIHKDICANDIDEMFKKLIKGQIDVLIANDLVATYYIKQSHIDRLIEMQNFYFTENEADGRLAFCKKEGIETVISIFNQNIEKMLLDGTIENIEKRYMK